VAEATIIEATIISKTSSSFVAKVVPQAAFSTMQGNVVEVEEEARHKVRLGYTLSEQEVEEVVEATLSEREVEAVEEVVEATSISESSSAPVAEAVPEAASSLKKVRFKATVVSTVVPVATVGKYPWNGMAQPNAGRPWASSTTQGNAEAVPEAASPLKKVRFKATVVSTVVPVANVGKYPWNGVSQPNAGRPWANSTTQGTS
jgi:hypothetical protein